jgi:hypothetical protein
MKKFAMVLMARGLLLGACSSDDETKEETTKAAETAETTAANENEKAAPKEEGDEKGVDVDKGLFNVEVTLPADFFEGEDMETVIANAEKEGVGEATLNEDGSVTYKMSKKKHKEMMTEMAKSIEDTKKDLLDSEDFQSLQAIETSKNYDTFTVQVDREVFENSMDGFATMSLGLVGCYYQAFNGTEPENLKVNIELEDAATGEVFDTIVYPDVLEEMEEMEE